MAKYDSLPVHPEKIKMIHNMLHTQPVNELWLHVIKLSANGGSQREKEISFKAYADARDKHLGLKPLIPMLEVKPGVRRY